jgi:hypothetical protein
MRKSIGADPETAASPRGCASAPHIDACIDDDLERLGNEIAELAAHVHAATYQLLVRLREFDRREGWGGGFRSCAHWLSWRTGIGLGAAREKVRVARALDQLPHLREAMRRGETSFAKIRAATRVATPDNEERLLDLARHGTASHMEKVVRAWRRVDRLAEQAEERERHRSRVLTLYADDDGMYVVRGRLDPEVGAVLERALASAVEALYGRSGAADGRAERADVAHARREAEARAGHARVASTGETVRDVEAAAGIEPATAEQRRSDALGLIAECALRSALDPTARPYTVTPWAEPDSGTRMVRADRFQVVVHVDADTLRESSDCGPSVLAGIRISAETSRRLACDAGRVIMTHDRDGSVLDVGRRSRTVPPAIRRALEQRDRGCRFPGCGLRFCDAHHIVHWADGGATRLDNLIYLCRRHHRTVHEEGFRVAFTDSGEIRFYRPDGQLIPDAPAAPRLPDDPCVALAATHRGAGLEIDARTTASSWAGDRLDLDFAVLTLRGP